MNSRPIVGVTVGTPISPEAIRDKIGGATKEWVASNYQPKGNYLTKVPSGYALTTDIPTKVSQLTNDSGYLTQHQDISGKLDASKLPEAIDTALAQAKASGEFDGKPGDKGDKGDKGTGITGIRIAEV